jgi:mannose-6-phosphate isomerase-like protein (cupin superfamily)
MLIAMTTIIKPWGKESILTPPDSSYTAKILYLTSGHSLSLQYHDQKTETLILAQGEATITLGPDLNHLQTQTLNQLQGYTITPNTIHQIKAISDCIIFEASTPEVGTTYRLQDPYHRPHETETIRNSPNRGWSI